MNDIAQTNPPIRTPGNRDRLERARAALMAYAPAAGDGDSREVLVDLLTDLRHWCEDTQLSFDAAAILSQLHYEAETAAEAP